MKPAFTFDEIREIEKCLIEKETIPSIILMENAGRNSFDAVKERFPELGDYDITIITGKGNNAGDGFTLARFFALNNIAVRVVMLAGPEELKGDALINYNLCLKFPSLISFGKEIILPRGKAIIVDAVLGTGIKGELDGRMVNAINEINRMRKSGKRIKTVSLDVPSGLMSGDQINPVVKADMTVTMGSFKTELMFGKGKESSGDVKCVNIGVGDLLAEKYNSYGKYVIDISDVRESFPARRRTSHKYSNGKVLIVGGSRELSGALMMSSLSALRSGAGAVCAAFPVSISKYFSRKLHEVMKVELRENSDGTVSSNQYELLKKRIQWADVVLLGPGLSVNEGTAEFVMEILRKCEKNLVIDADGLNNLANDTSVLKLRPKGVQVVLTPHPGEFSKLAGCSMNDLMLNRFEIVRDFAGKYDVNVVLKSETTVSCDTGGKIFINTSGNEALATAGSGDILSGLIASVFARTSDPVPAMICGNYIHGLCADIYYSRVRNKQSATPTDLIGLIRDAVSIVLKD